MRFLVDQNLPAWLADWLIEQGEEAEHVRLLGLQTADDADILAAARARSAVIISRDADFANLGRSGVSVVWVRIGNTTNARLGVVWPQLWPEVRQALAAGETLVEVTTPG